MTDAELIARVRAGDREAYAGLVQRYQAPLFRYAYGMVLDGDTAADLVQDTLVKAYVSLAGCRDPQRFRAWLFRIMSNQCKDYLKNRRRAEVSLDAGGSWLASTDQLVTMPEHLEIARAVERALGRLPGPQRQAFLLKHVEGRSYEEMTEILGSSVSALKMRVLRAREGLREQLAGVRP